MLVDNPISQLPYSPPYDPIADFLNLDLFSSATSSSSPHNAFVSDSDPPFFNFSLDDDYTKADPLAPPTPSTLPYDFLGAFPPDSPFTSPATSSSPDSLPSLPSPMFAIDPQLVGTPATSKGSDDFDEDEERDVDADVDEDDEDEDDDIDTPIVTKSPLKKTVIIVPPVATATTSVNAKSVGTAKTRKGTVHGGGVVKKSSANISNSPSASTVLSSRDKENSLGIRDSVVEDGKPADYARLSSKEKRQLRNKISARNFRVRRKEYISMLEGDVAERDRLLEAIRTQLGASLSENLALRQEIDALKKTLLVGRGAVETPVLPPPAPIPEHVPAAVPPTISNNTTSTPSTPTPIVSRTTNGAQLLTPYTQKDLPTSPRIGARGFWGGAGVGLGGLGGVTPVHTTLIPEWGVFGTLAKPVSSLSQENINPSLNTSGTPTSSNVNGSTSGIGLGAPQGFDAFAELNPFNFKVLDPYRMQLWGKIAAQVHAHQQQSSQQQQQQQPQQHSNLVDRMRPLYFTASTRQMHSPAAFGTSLSGKTSFTPASSLLNQYPSPPPSPHLSAKNISSSSSSSISVPTREQQQTAMVAALASQTLFKKLGSAFWEAFSGSGSGSGSATVTGGMRAWDAEKVRKVLEGKAVLRVVDVESPVSVAPSPSSVHAVLPAPTSASANASTSNPRPTSTVKQCMRETSACAVSVVTDILEESMRSLSISKKSGSA